MDSPVQYLRNFILPRSHLSSSKSDSFPINRGVLQGDVISPLFFIMSLELILRTHDAATQDKGVPLADTLIHLLGYADDVVVMEPGDEWGLMQLESRVNNIEDGSKADTDMDINREKTIVLQVRQQDKTSVTTQEEAREACKFTCPHLNCGFKLISKAAMLIHAGHCKWKNEFEVSKIVSHRGPTVARRNSSIWSCIVVPHDNTRSDGRITMQATILGNLAQIFIQISSGTMNCRIMPMTLNGNSDVRLATYLARLPGVSRFTPRDHMGKPRLKSSKTPWRTR